MLDCMQGSSAPINIPIMSRLPSLRDDESDDAKKAAAFVPPHLLDESVSPSFNPRAILPSADVTAHAATSTAACIFLQVFILTTATCTWDCHSVL